MTCTGPGCTNTQCYICSQSCDYNHFLNKARGGSACPLWDANVEERHEGDIKRAQRAAIQAVTNRDPNIKSEMLGINMSVNVKLDDANRREADEEYMRKRIRQDAAPRRDPGLRNNGNAGDFIALARDNFERQPIPFAPGRLFVQAQAAVQAAVQARPGIVHHPVKGDMHRNGAAGARIAGPAAPHHNDKPKEYLPNQNVNAGEGGINGT